MLGIDDSFRVNLYRPSFSEIQENVPKTTPKSIPESTPKSIPESVLKNLNKTQQKILKIILENPKATQSELAKQLNLSLSAVKKSMKDMVETGVIVRVGANKGGCWEIIK